jgi:hypothetical protein
MLANHSNLTLKRSYPISYLRGTGCEAKGDKVSPNITTDRSLPGRPGGANRLLPLIQPLDVSLEGPLSEDVAEAGFANCNELLWHRMSKSADYFHVR